MSLLEEATQYCSEVMVRPLLLEVAFTASAGYPFWEAGVRILMFVTFRAPWPPRPAAYSKRTSISKPIMF